MFVLKYMKKFLINLFILGVSLLPSLSFVNFASAVGLNDAADKLNTSVGPSTQVGLTGNLTETITTVVTAALALVGTIFLLLTIYAGILWMTAGGQEEKIEKAQGIIKATIIGLGITMAAYAITAFVGGRLSGV